MPRCVNARRDLNDRARAPYPCDPHRSLFRHQIAIASQSRKGVVSTRMNARALMTTPPDSPASSPLSGMLVLELGARCSAAVAGSVLAQLGATVLSVESITEGEFEQPKWRFREVMAAGKLSVAINTAKPADRHLIERLLRATEVVITSRDVERLAFGAELPSVQLGPLIACDTSAYGARGPLAGRPDTDAQIQALCGMSDATGLPEGPPLPVGLPLIEHLAGIHAAASIVAARLAKPSGRQAISVSLYDVGFSAMTSFLPSAFGGEQKASNRVGNRHALAAPWNVYQARDGWLLLCAGNNEQWQRIGGALGEEGRLLVERYPTMGERVAHADIIDAALQAWIGQHCIAHCVHIFSHLGIPCGPVAPIQGYPREDNLTHRGMIQHVFDHASGQIVSVPGSALKMGLTPGVAPRSVSAPDADRPGVLALLASRDSARAHATAAADTTASARRATPTTPISPSASNNPATRPLSGLRVIEIGHYTTAPAAARQLAALGAEVIKLEPPEGEAVRHWPPMRAERSVFFTFQNSDKRSLVLDLNSPEQLAGFKALIASSDVLVENLRPGALARKGLDSESLLALNPRLVVCAISGFGFDSLYAGRPAFDTVVQAMSGMMDVVRCGEIPMKTGPSMADVMGAALAVAAILGALAYRNRSGEGQFIDIAMQDVCAWATQTAWNGKGLPQFDLNPQADGVWQLRRTGRVLTAPSTPTSPGEASVPVLRMLEVIQAQQTIANDLWFKALAEDGSEHSVIRQPAIFANTPSSIPVPARALGSDTEAILSEMSRLASHDGTDRRSRR